MSNINDLSKSKSRITQIARISYNIVLFIANVFVIYTIDTGIIVRYNNLITTACRYTKTVESERIRDDSIFDIFNNRSL